MELKLNGHYRIKFVVNEHRKDKHKKPPNPIVRSRFTQYLWDRATWRDEE